MLCHVILIQIKQGIRNSILILCSFLQVVTEEKLKEVYQAILADSRDSCQRRQTCRNNSLGLSRASFHNAVKKLRSQSFNLQDMPTDNNHEKDQGVQTGLQHEGEEVASESPNSRPS